MGKSIPRTTQEDAVWRMFTSQGTGAYQAFGCCANPRCETPTVVSLVCGRKPRARVCLTCFEYDFKCAHPSLAKIEGLRR